MSMDEQTAYFSELAARLGAATVYADIPGIWKTDGTLNPNAGVHTRMIPVRGYTKMYGRTSMDHNGVAIAFFDQDMVYMPDISIVGDDAHQAVHFGNNIYSDPLSIPSSAYYVSVSGWGTPTDYPVLFWGPMPANAENDGFDPGVLSTGTIAHMGVSYIDFGARLDGVHDDTDAVVACHEYANAHGCSVYNHRGIVYLPTALHPNNAEIKTDVDWTGTTFLIKPPIENERIVFGVAPDEELSDYTLTASDISQLHDTWMNIPFMNDFPNELLTLYTDIVIGLRDGSEDYTQPSYYSETVTVDRNGGLMDGPLFLDLTGASSVTMKRRSIMDKPITIKGGTFKLDYDQRFVNPYFLYISRANVTVEGLQCDAGIRRESGNSSYRAELIRADYAYNLCFRDCVFENFTNFFPRGGEWNQVAYVLVCTHCSTVMVDHCHFLRGWGPMQTSWCKRLTVRDSVMGRIDNHYGCRDYLIDGCTMVTSHSNINVGYGDGYLTVRDCKFIKTRDYDTIFNSRLIYCREDYCSIFKGIITLENIQVETFYETTVLRAALVSSFQYKKAASDQILPCKLPKVRMRNIYFRHFSDNPVTLTIAEYGVSPSASALSYGSVYSDDIAIDGVYCDQAARVLPMFSRLTGTSRKTWLMKVTNYNCPLAVGDPATETEADLAFNRGLTMLVHDPVAEFNWLFGKAGQPIYVWKRVQ